MTGWCPQEPGRHPPSMTCRERLRAAQSRDRTEESDITSASPRVIDRAERTEVERGETTQTEMTRQRLKEEDRETDRQSKRKRARRQRERVACVCVCVSE